MKSWDDPYAKGGKRKGKRCESYYALYMVQCMKEKGHFGTHRWTSPDGRSIDWESEE